MRTIDIYGENRYEKYSEMREACRGIVIRDGKILMSYEVNSDQWFIPGGGVENNESLQECCVRELAEEMGAVVTPKDHFLTIKEYYEEWFFISHYFICDYAGETERQLTEREVAEGLEPRWIPIEKAIDIFSKYQEYAGENEMKRGAYLREYKALLMYGKNSMNGQE